MMICRGSSVDRATATETLDLTCRSHMDGSLPTDVSRGQADFTKGRSKRFYGEFFVAIYVKLKFRCPQACLIYICRVWTTGGTKPKSTLLLAFARKGMSAH
jgi:hypothetical protein